MTIKVATIIGARPQYIKHSLLSKEIKKYKNIKDYIILTGQHYDFNMSKIFEKELKISKPFANLNINKNSSINNIAKTMLKLEKILIALNLDFVLVYGDTDTTLSGAIVAKKLNIPIIHVESGLRSYDQSMPEEQNRIIVDRISDFLITPTSLATENLIKEGVNKKKIFNFGDIMYETWLHFKKQIKDHNYVLKKYNIEKNKYNLLTIHRNSNTKNINVLKKIFNQLKKNNFIYLFPIHPRTKKFLEKFNINIPNNIIVVSPLSYKEMISVQLNCKYILTDSGGLQKEAYFAKKNCLILRDTSEWKELIEKKYSFLIKKNRINLNHLNYLNKKFDSKFYGNGNTCKKIISLLIKNAK